MDARAGGERALEAAAGAELVVVIGKSLGSSAAPLVERAPPPG